MKRTRSPELSGRIRIREKMKTKRMTNITKREREGEQCLYKFMEKRNRGHDIDKGREKGEEKA